ncbi:FISUMP domain-containing protein [Psychroflexus planctonicus]|uniref:Fibrobacter succinogenes major paralogous domain-containing protein n=1 Tax=Psychroflexus planctonicus TaxID=1526575 RepID=A0ABQ1SNX9_9FLAO|nr:FISUMP domain-containing protein [Psychroflexus planctonicus]GGE45235.1 hypothetical protein GCM10010832_26430 [Psychroflexus planctonicus]
MKTITKFLSISLLLLGLTTTQAQVGIGTETPHDSAMLEVESTEKGFLPPRMDTDARNDINSPAEGLTIYNTDEKCLQWYNSTGWFNTCDGSLFVPAGPTTDCVSGFIPPFLSANETEIVDVLNPITGDTWMDRNLGAHTADRTPPASYSNGGTDCWAYGNLYQWGRNSDGHEDRTSSNTLGPVTAGSEGSNFIRSNGDWLSNKNDARWGDPIDADKGVHDPCPDSYRVPTQAELLAEWDSWDGVLDQSEPALSEENSEDAINSPLKLPVAGYRIQGNGLVENDGNNGSYWSSTVSGNNATSLSFDGNFSLVSTFENRAGGKSVRCIKDEL